MVKVSPFQINAETLIHRSLINLLFPHPHHSPWLVAIRILRSARELGWRTAAIYTTEPSLDASHATYADEATELNNVSDYMNVDVIVQIAARYVRLILVLTW